MWREKTDKGWIILEPMGKDFNGKQVLLPYTPAVTDPLPRLYPTKSDAMTYKCKRDKVVRATVTTEWED